MSSEEPKLNDSEAENKPTSGEQRLRRKLPTSVNQPVCSCTSIQRSTIADESRASGDVDFGQLLDQFEQEQATLAGRRSRSRHRRRYQRTRRRHRLWLQIGRHRQPG